MSVGEGNVGVEGFFNERAPKYAEKPFVHYLFSKREDAALSKDNLSNKKLLDVGCGTGRLYSRLIKDYPAGDFKYLGIDPAEGMLNLSTIPNRYRRVGTVADLSKRDTEIDRIFLLGVTTYIPKAQLRDDMINLSKRLTREGEVIIHFTNARSVEVMCRQLLRPLLQWFGRNDSIANGDFTIYPWKYSEAWALITGFQVVREEKLPATIPFLQYLSEHLAIGLSKKIDRFAPMFLRMDYLLVFKREK